MVYGLCFTAKNRNVAYNFPIVASNGYPTHSGVIAITIAILISEACSHDARVTATKLILVLALPLISMQPILR